MPRRTVLPAGVCFHEHEFSPERWDHYWEQRTRVRRGFPHEAAMFGAEAVQHIQRFLLYLGRGDHEFTDYNERTAIHMARLAGRRYIGEVLALQPVRSRVPPAIQAQYEAAVAQRQELRRHD